MTQGKIQLYAGLCLAVAGLGARSFGADVAAGRAAFRQTCVLCHTAEPGDNGGAQGPSLYGVFGRAAAGNPKLSYTRALSASHLTWDAATLNRFLESPTTVVPGSAMVIAVPDKTQREDLVAYFQSLTGLVEAVQAAPLKGEADWKKDAPGRNHRVILASLPAPFDTPAANNRAKLIARPADAQLALPRGFRIDVFASELQGPRKMLVAANGDVFVTETSGGRVSVLHPSADGATAAGQDVYAQGLEQPFGLAFYPNAQQPQWLYVAEINRVVRFAYRTGDVKPRRELEVVVAELPAGRGHRTRDIAFSPDGSRMFVSVGSGSNVAENMSKKSPADIAAWEAQHGLGAAWDLETNRAAVLTFKAGAKDPGTIFAAGIRNCVSLTVQPHTGDLWCTTNERDLLGDDLVPDYSTRVRQGGFYGWPWYYLGDNEDPRLKGDRPDLRGKVLVPDVLYQAHSAPLNLTFYTATSGSSAFPPEYLGDAFATFHGSWNRGFRTGHKLVRVHMKDGVPTGDYEDFLTGFIVDDGKAWGRPVATAVLHDGSLLMSDDGANLIYRISYRH